MPGDLTEFPEMMRHNWKSVFSFVFAMVRESTIADDLAQETFVRAYLHWEEFRGESTVKTWLFAIAKNVATDHLRSAFVRRVLPFSGLGTRREEDTTGNHETYLGRHGRQRMSRHNDESISTQLAPSAESQFFDSESVNDIWREVMSLRRVQREIVLLRVREGLSFPEIAQVLDMSEGNARVQYHRAIQHLKAKLHREVPAHEL